jgi:hypothetical protein
MFCPYRDKSSGYVTQRALQLPVADNTDTLMLLSYRLLRYQTYTLDMCLFGKCRQ